MNRSRTLVLSAAAVVVVLSATLVMRLRASAPPNAKSAPALPRFTGEAPPSRVAAAKAVDPATLKPPCWGCPEGSAWPITYRTDLDLLAPPGDGAGNAALWLKDFARPNGARLAEAEAATKRRIPGPSDYGLVLPPDDPLLREAEPWADQSTMRFYPDVWAFEGFSTPIPNLQLAITLAKSWAARAAAHPEAPGALEDGRRAIRWGRLLRQDDATIIQDLVGLACIRLGAEELYALAQKNGDHRLALAAAIALGEHAPQRFRTAQTLTKVGLWPLDEGRGIVEPTDKRVEDLIGVARADPDRRFRLEAIAQLAVARVKGTHDQRTKAEAALDELASGPRPAEAAQAQWGRRVTWREISP